MKNLNFIIIPLSRPLSAWADGGPSAHNEKIQNEKPTLQFRDEYDNLTVSRCPHGNWKMGNGESRFVRIWHGFFL
jgi:hypothetical protein